MHKVSDQALITPKLLRRMEGEAEGPQYWALLQTNEGKFLTHGMGPQPDPIILAYSQEALSFLNRKLHHDGAWVMVWKSLIGNDNFLNTTGAVYGGMTLLWMDEDGDVQFPIMFDRPVTELITEGAKELGECAEAAWKTWHRLMREVLAPKPEQMTKSALQSTLVH